MLLQKHRPPVALPGSSLKGLKAATVAEILELPDDFYAELGLDEVVSPLRMRGMGSMVFRIKRQLREQAESAP